MAVDGFAAHVRLEKPHLAGGEDAAQGMVLPWDPGFQDGLAKTEVGGGH